MARRKMLSVWVDPGGVVHFVSECMGEDGTRESSRRAVRPYSPKLAHKLNGVITHLQQTDWQLRLFYGDAVGWVAEKGD